MSTSTFSSSAAMVEVPTSKSIANRLLIIQALSQSQGKIQSLSDSDDTHVLQQALQSDSDEINVGHAGTAYRFLTAFYALQQKTVVLDGSERMCQRPIGILVDALRELGAEIDYLGGEGYPPLQIQGGNLTHNELTIKANTSSQYISALMLIAPYLPEGLTMHLSGNVVSRPYIDMTAKLMAQCDAVVETSATQISVKAGAYNMPAITVEADWSGIAFWYVWVLLGKVDQLTIKNVSKHSVQGDAYVQHIFAPFGVRTSFEGAHMVLSFYGTDRTSWPTHFDFTHTPDLTQPFMVAMAGIGHPVEVTGVHHLQLKETKRLDALQTELAKFGAETKVTENSIALLTRVHRVSQPVTVETYHDHRMAMAFAPLRTLGWDVTFTDPNVVSKSYPKYWKEVGVFDVVEE